MTTSKPHLMSGPITLQELVRFAGASGDFNPLHFDPETARLAGFADVVVVGALTASKLMSELVRSKPTPDLRRFTVKFLAPVLIGSALEVSIDDDEGESISRNAVVFVDGRPVVEAKASFGGPLPDLDTLPDDFAPLDPPYRWVAEEGAARQFASAIGDAAQIRAGSPVPPTFAQTAMRWSPSERDFVQRLDFDFARIVHGGSTFEFAADPIRAGEEFLVTEGHSGLQQVEARSGPLRIADAHLIITDLEGIVRARVTQRIIERAQQ